MNRKIIVFCSQLLLILISAFVLKTNQTEYKYKPSDYFYQQRAFPFDGINRQAYNEAIDQSQKLRSSQQKTLGVWESVGPFNIGGRLTDVELSPADESEIWLGTASGGIFKTTDAGATFYPVFENANSLSIGDISIGQVNTNVVYVGTGEANPGGGSTAYDGDGIYKSTNGGQSWENMGLNQSGSIGRIVTHPQNDQIAYVAAMGYLYENNAERGVYKTTDGGESWQNVLYLNDSTGAIDLAIHPENPDTIYAATWERRRRLEYYTYGGESSGIFRSYDGGENWMELENGLPSGPNIGRIGIGISKSDPNVLYAIYADKTGYFEGLYKSEDGGDTWQQTNDGSLNNVYASYGWWFGRLKIDPQNADIVYVIGYDLYKTVNGGNSWQYITGSAHVDMHEVAISPTNSGKIYLGNDGGFYISSNGGSSWVHNMNLPITQFYTVAIDASAPYRFYGGAQDNGTNRTLNGNPQSWAQIYYGDGFQCLIDYTDNRYVYAEYQYGNFARSTNFGSSFSSATSGISSGDRKNWNTPVVMNPINPSSLYFGANRLYKSTNRAINWSAISPDLSNGSGSGNQTFGTITTIDVSPADTNIIYAGTDDANVWISMNNGMSWSHISDDLPNRWVTSVVADPEFANVAYVTLSGFRENEYMPHVFKTEDNGLSWLDISEGLPEAPVNDLIVWSDLMKRIIVGTDVGVFYHDEGVDGWHLFAEGLPLVPITDLAADKASGTIAAATYGRSMYAMTISVGMEKVETNNDLDVSVFPNPASSFIKVKGLEQDMNFDFLVYNINGQAVLNRYQINKETSIDVGNLINGVYFYQILTDNQAYTGKLLIK